MSYRSRVYKAISLVLDILRMWTINQMEGRVFRLFTQLQTVPLDGDLPCLRQFATASNTVKGNCLNCKTENNQNLEMRPHS